MRLRITILFLASLFVASESLQSQEKTDQQSETEQQEKTQHPSEILSIPLFDGETLTGKLFLPAETEVRELVIFIHGTGPGTYLNRRKARGVEFDYFGMFAEQFNNRGIAFFSYNKRGVELGDEPPMYEKVDREKFHKVVPSNEVRDIGTIIEFLRKDQRLARSKVVLFGASEGTIIASMVAENEANNVDALFLLGYAHENMWDIIKWQYSGESSMVAICPTFDADKNGTISKQEYESEEDRPTRYRKAVMQGATFELLDTNKDEEITASDFAQRVAPIYNRWQEKVAAKDDDWIWKYYFRVSSDWLHEHFTLEPNKSRLPRMDLPIYIFHGTDDPNVDVRGVYDLEKRFAILGKTNLHAFVFEGHDHDLNFLEWPLKNKIPEGIARIFEVASELNQ